MLRVARIVELQDQLERFERSHADAMAEMSRIQAAEREAATARITELEREVARLKRGAFVLILLAIGLGWLAGHEANRPVILMILGGFLLCGSLIWIRHGQSRRSKKRPADVISASRE
jgi:hypothetical protein